MLSGLVWTGTTACSSGSEKGDAAGSVRQAFGEASCATASAFATFTDRIDYTSPTTYGVAACDKAIVLDVNAYGSTTPPSATRLAWNDVLPTTKADCEALWLASYLYTRSGSTWVQSQFSSANGAWSGDRCLGPSLAWGTDVMPAGASYRITASARTVQTTAAPTRSIRVLTQRACQPTASDPRAAVPLDPTVPMDFATAAAPLYLGPNASQQGAAPGALDPKRLSVIQGQVRNAAGDPFPCIEVSVPGAPELGKTTSFSDGSFAMVVNGGGPITVALDRPGFYTAQRTAETRWLGFANMGDVRLVGFGPAHAIDPNNVSVIAGAVETDPEGTRQAVLLVPKTTGAIVVGATGLLTNYSISVKEVTNRTQTRDTMPATLPDQSAYTYAVNLSVAGHENRDVVFTKPIPVYVNNILNFTSTRPDEGEVVPVGRYNLKKKQWEPKANGLVIEIRGKDANGLAQIDFEGTAAPDTRPLTENAADWQAELTALGAQIPARYPIGTKLWRFTVQQFSTWDANWGWGPPANAVAPSNPPPYTTDVTCPSTKTGSVIECESQNLREDVAIAGTPFTLSYNSGRQPGGFRPLRIPLTGATLPPNLASIELIVEVAGRRFAHSLGLPAPEQLPYVHDFTWNGLDAAGRPVQGSQKALVLVGYTYPGSYGRTSSFGSRGTASITASTDRFQATLWQGFVATIPRWDAAQAGLGGWSLSPHHGYDREANTLQLGNGKSELGLVSGVMRTLVGTGSAGVGGENVTGVSSPLDLQPQFDWVRSRGIVVAPDNTVYFTERNRIRKVTPAGFVSTFAGTGTATAEPFGDGGPAIDATFAEPTSLALGADGSLYVVDSGHYRVRLIGPDGVIRNFAGTGVKAPFPGTRFEGSPTAHALGDVASIALGPDGALYISDHPTGNSIYVRRIQGGLITTLPGGGPSALIKMLAVAQDGTVYFSQESQIRRLNPDGTTDVVVGAGSTGNAPLYGDGQLATSASGGIHEVHNIAVGRDGLLYFADAGHHAIRRINSLGRFETVAGTIGVSGSESDGRLATATPLNTPESFAFGPDGALYVIDTWNHKIRATGVNTTIGDGYVTSADGSEAYLFDASGRHAKTFDGMTGFLKYAFRYNNGYLTGVADRELTDPNRRETVIERDTQGVAQAIVAPDGQRTTLSIVNGELRSVTAPSPDSGLHSFDYHPGRLLHHLRDPEINAKAGTPYTFTFDQGRLVTDVDALGQSQALAYTPLTGTHTGWKVTHTQAGKVTTYDTQRSFELLSKTITGPNQLTTAVDTRIDGAAQYVAPDNTAYSGRISRTDGSSLFFQTRADVRLSPFIGRELEVTAPGGPTRTTTRTRSVVRGAQPTSITTYQDLETTNGRTSTTTYVGAARLLTSTSPSGRRVRTTFDTLGRVASRQVDGFVATTFGYDPTTGKLASATASDGTSARLTTFNYFPSSAGSKSGYLSAVTSTLNLGTNHTASYDRNVFGQPLSETLGSEITGFAWDKNGNLTGLTPPGRPQHVLAYTPLNQLDLYTAPNPTPAGARAVDYTYTVDRKPWKTITPDNLELTSAYDSAGRLGTITTPTGVTTFDYYPAGTTAGTAPGRVSAVRGPYGVDVAFNYQGPLLTRETWSGQIAGSVARTFDNDFAVATETVTAGSTTQALSYGYDSDKLVTCAATAPCTGTPPANGLTIARSALNGYVESITQGSVTETYTYNDFGELAKKTAKFGTTLLHEFVYDVKVVGQTRDSLGRIKRRAETIGTAAPVVTTYQYNAQGALTHATNGSANETYAYAALNGNRSSATTPSGTVSSIVYDDQDRLKQYGTITYDYTLNGELKTKTEPGGKVTQYTYDVLGNLRTVVLPTTPNATTIEYVADGLGRRVAKKVNNVVTKRWLYRDGLKPIAELDGAGAIVSTFVYASNPITPDFMLRAGKTYRIFTDELGSPRLVINVASVAEQPFKASYTAFGEAIIAGTADFLPFGFAGGLYDADTKLVRFGARDYDPSVGRWVSKDPILFGGGQANLYAYVGNDPVNGVDPTGLYWIDANGVRNWDEWETQRILADQIANFASSSRFEVCAEAFAQGGFYGGRFDFKFSPFFGNDYFWVPGVGRMNAATFGNYFAGYVYQTALKGNAFPNAGRDFALWGGRVTHPGGVDDANSVNAINRGAFDADAYFQTHPWPGDGG